MKKRIVVAAAVMAGIFGVREAVRHRNRLREYCAGLLACKREPATDARSETLAQVA